MIIPILICVLTDLHFKTGSNYSYLLPSIQPCEMIVVNGDMVDFDIVPGCPDSPECDLATNFMMDFATNMNKSFMFTMGNHDSIEGSNKTFASSVLGKHPLHVGTCNAGYTSCIHKELKIATLYSGDYQCSSGSDYGCPTVEDANYINNQLSSINLLFTHIPPPAADNVQYTGIKSDHVCGSTYTCSWAKKQGVLPSIPTKMHFYGHDHNNLYVGKNGNTQYVSLLKSGTNGYGPCFSNNEPGYTTIYTDQISFHLFNSTILDINHIPREDCKQVASNKGQIVWIVIVILCILIITLISLKMRNIFSTTYRYNAISY